MAEKTCGSFSIVDGKIQGPAEYMRDPNGFDAVSAAIYAGKNATFNYGCVGRDPEVAFLVAVQTHYAGWRGQQALCRTVSL